MVYEAPELMNLSDLLNATGLTGVFVFFMIPSIVIVLCVYAAYRHRQNAKLKKDKRKQEKLLKKQAIEEHKQLVREENEVLKEVLKRENIKITEDMLDDTDSIYGSKVDKAKFSSLTLEFDETGRAK